MKPWLAAGKKVAMRVYWIGSGYVGQNGLAGRSYSAARRAQRHPGATGYDPAYEEALAYGARFCRGSPEISWPGNRNPPAAGKPRG